MGLFDYLRVEFKHPDIPPGEVYQTSDTPYHYLGNYTITDQGRLVQHNGDRPGTEWGPLVGDVELLWDGPLYFMTVRPQYGPPRPPSPPPIIDEAYMESIGAKRVWVRSSRRKRPGATRWLVPVRTSDLNRLQPIGVWYRVEFIAGQLSSLEMIDPDRIMPTPDRRTFRYLKNGKVFIASFNEYGVLTGVEAA